VKVLGAILAGGASRRFGSDKAEAMLDGRKLIDHVADTLRRDCDALVICGRTHSQIRHLDDRPAAGLGPLGGLCAALTHGRDTGFDAVLSAPCDTPGLPHDLLAILSLAGPASYAADHPVIGLWSCALADRLQAHLAQSADRSMRAWARVAGAAPVPVAGIFNINTPEDLAGAGRIEAVGNPPEA